MVQDAANLLGTESFQSGVKVGMLDPQVHAK